MLALCRRCPAQIEIDLLAGPGEPNGLVSHLEMLSGGVDGGVVDGESLALALKKDEGEGWKLVVCCPIGDPHGPARLWSGWSRVDESAGDPDL